MKTPAFLAISLSFVLFTFLPNAAAKTVKVFILAGQSNMEGKAKVSLMEHQATQPETEGLFTHLRTGDGQWKERVDVWIKFLDRQGNLTVGFGSPDRTGPELNFGHVVGDHFEDPVLIIKTAWGGKSLFRDFRPPSSGLPDEFVLQDNLEKAHKKKPETTLKDIEASYGQFYRQMIEEVNQTLKNLGTLFPELRSHQPEIAGFVWFQGWNDMINADYTAAYTKQMANFIRDVRKDLKSPDLPFVIGQLGVGGANPSKPNEGRDCFKAAQAAAAELPEFKENVAVVKTDQYWDETAQAVFDKGWKENFDEWLTVGSDRPYHYLGSAKTYLGIGTGFGEAMLQLMGVNLIDA